MIIVDTWMEAPDIRLNIGTLIADCDCCIKNCLNELPPRKHATIVSSPNTTYNCDVCLARCSMVVRGDGLDLCLNCSHGIDGGHVGNANVPLMLTINRIHEHTQKYRRAIIHSFVYMHLTRIAKFNDNGAYFNSCSICNTFVQSDVYEWTNPYRTWDEHVLTSKHRNNMAVCKQCGLHAFSCAAILRDRCTRMLFHSRIIGAGIHNDLHMAIYECVRALICADSIAIP